MIPANITLTWTSEKKPLTVFQNAILAQGAERTPAELRTLAATLLQIANDAEKREPWEAQRGAITRKVYDLDHADQTDHDCRHEKAICISCGAEGSPASLMGRGKKKNISQAAIEARRDNAKSPKTGRPKGPRQFAWNEFSHFGEIPSWLMNLIPWFVRDTDLGGSFAKVRAKVLAEIDAYERGEKSAIMQKEYLTAVKFIESTGGRASGTAAP